MTPWPTRGRLGRRLCRDSTRHPSGEEATVADIANVDRDRARDWLLLEVRQLTEKRDRIARRLEVARTLLRLLVERSRVS